MILARSGPVFPRLGRLPPVRDTTVGRRSSTHRSGLALSGMPHSPALANAVRGHQAGVGFIVLLLGASLLAPIPLSNLPSVLMIVLVAFAYLDDDGMLLCAALSAPDAVRVARGGWLADPGRCRLFQGCYTNRLGFATRHTLNVTCTAGFPSEEIQ
jgi:exopolysaccharide synthesis protein ExoD